MQPVIVYSRGDGTRHIEALCDRNDHSERDKERKRERERERERGREGGRKREKEREIRARHCTRRTLRFHF